MDIRAEKRAIRSQMRRMREDLDLAQYRARSNAVSERLRLCSEWRRAESVHIYVAAVNNEVDTLGLIFRLFDEGRSVIVPVCEHSSRSLKNVRITSMDQLTPCRFGLMEPACSPGSEYRCPEDRPCGRAASGL